MPKTVSIEPVNKDEMVIAINGDHLRVPFDRFPLFRDMTLDEIYDVRFFDDEILEWDKADVRMYIDTFYHPEKYARKWGVRPFAENRQAPGMNHCCEMMQMMIDQERSIVFIPEFREYGVPIRDGGCSILVMTYCPWCGKRLPDSLRDVYFDILEKAGIPYPCDDSELPEPMRSEKWWMEDPQYGPPFAAPGSGANADDPGNA